MMLPCKLKTNTANWSRAMTLFMLVLFHLGVLWVLPCISQDRMLGSGLSSFSDSYEEYGKGSSIFLNFYQKWISPVKGGNHCPMHPSCSQYAKILFEFQPAYKAYIGTCERLLRCGHELYLYKTVRVGDFIRWHDPPNIPSIYWKGAAKPADWPRSQTLKPPLQQHKTSTAKTDSTTEGFADFLFKSKDYYRALTEYLRLQYHSSDSLQRLYYLRKAGLCYYFGADYNKFVGFVEQHRNEFNLLPAYKSELEVLLGKTYYRLQNYSQAISTLQWAGISQGAPYYDEAKFMLGLSYARIFFWEAASEYLAQIGASSPRNKMAKAIVASLTREKAFPTRQPWLAGALSAAIPGIGYLYSHRPGTGLASFVINGLIIWTVRDAIKREHYGFATLTSFLGLGWYIGNVKGSVAAAKTFNTNVRNRFVDRMLENVDVDDHTSN